MNPRPVDAHRNDVLVTKFATSAGVEAIRNALVSDIGGNRSLNPQPLPPGLSIPSGWGAASLFR